MTVTGINHIATLSTELDRTVRFYTEAFDGKKVFEMPAEADHPRMAIVELGGGFSLNIFEVTEDSIIGDRRQQGGRGPIDHYAIGVESRAALDAMGERLLAAGAELGEVQQLGDMWSLFFRDVDGMELEVVAPLEDVA